MSKSRSLRILLVTHYYATHRGGVEIVAGELASRLARGGAQIVWAASGPAPTATAPDDGPIERLTFLPMRAWNFAERWLGFPYPLWGPLSLIRLFRAIRRCHVVHLHDILYFGNVWAFGWARLMGKPVVVTQHIGLVPYSNRALRWLLQAANHSVGRLVLKGSTRVVFIAAKVRDYFSRFVRFRREPLLVPNGVDRTRFCPLDFDERRRLREGMKLDGDRPVLLFVGRFVEKKGLHLLRELAAGRPDCQWLFIGWGPEDPARWGLPQVRSLGQLGHAQLRDYYRAADLLLLPSVGEGFPLVIQEAMACGTPVLTSTDTAQGMPEFQQVAWICEPQAAPMANLLAEILDERARWPERRETAARFARERWDWETCAEEYQALFSRIIHPQEIQGAHQPEA